MSAFEPGDKVCLPNSSASHTVVGADDSKKHVKVFDHSDGRVRTVPESSLGSPAAQKAANDAYAKVASGNASDQDVADLHRHAQAVRDSRPSAISKG